MTNYGVATLYVDFFVHSDRMSKFHAAKERVDAEEERTCSCRLQRNYFDVDTQMCRNNMARGYRQLSTK